LIEATSLSGRRTERRNRRVETASGSSPTASPRAGKAGKFQFLLAVRRSNPFDVDPAAMKGYWALSPAAPVLMTLVALAAQVGGLFLQKILERCDPGQQTEGLKAALNLLEFTASRCSAIEPSAITEVVSRIVFVMGVAPLCGFSTPSLPAQGSSAQLRSATSSGTSPHPTHAPEGLPPRRCVEPAESLGRDIVSPATNGLARDRDAIDGVLAWDGRAAPEVMQQRRFIGRFFSAPRHHAPNHVTPTP
jgi:hypothetical protein